MKDSFEERENRLHIATRSWQRAGSDTSLHSVKKWLCATQIKCDKLEGDGYFAIVFGVGDREWKTIWKDNQREKINTRVEKRGTSTPKLM